MVELLGLILISFFITSFLLVPFIDLLFYLRRVYKRKISGPKEDFNATFNKIMVGKDVETPVGGGWLLIVIVVLLNVFVTVFYRNRISNELWVLLFTIISFGLIGFIDDKRKIFASFVGIYPGIRARYMIILQILFAAVVALLLYYAIGLNNIFIPIFGNIVLGWWYIPMAIFIIVAFSNAYNIADGLDGLAGGLLLICLFAFLALASTVFDIPIAIFVGIWIGALIAFLYFNIFPARIYLGDAGALAFGATLAVIGLLTGKILGLAVIGGVFIVIISTSMLQIFSKKYLKRKIFPIAPIHLLLRHIGWEEPKVVVRFWLIGGIMAIFGLWLAILSK